MPLYPKQQEVADNLFKAYQNPNHISQGRLYVSGEMGVGKTYIASALIAKLQPKHTLIMAPNTVLPKWQKVLKEYTDLHSKIITKQSSFNDMPDIVLCSYKNYKLLINYSKNSQDTKIALKEFQRHITNAQARDDYLMLNKLTDNKESTSLWSTLDAKLQTSLMTKMPYFDFVVADEVHLLKPSTQAFATIIGLLINQKTKFLGLTGTIFNQNIRNLYQLLFLTNPLLMNQFQAINGQTSETYTLDRYRIHSYHPLNYFINAIWQYIAAQISLVDISKTSTEEFDLKQAIMPLKGLTLTHEQKLWQAIATDNMKSLYVKQKQIDKIINNYFDLPSNKQPVITMTRKNECNPYIANYTERSNEAAAKHKVFCGMYLKPIALNKTAKFKQCQAILKEYPQKTIIFVQDKNLVEPLSNNLKNSSYVPNKIAVSKRADYINNLLETHQSVVITSNTLATGVDLNKAQNVIWYQVPANVSQILQAQRRVLRLSDHIKESKVWYLYYSDTSQEDTIMEVANSAINNSATYNERRTDNLANMSHILFGDFENE